VGNVSVALDYKGLFLQVSPGDTEISYAARDLRYLLAALSGNTQGVIRPGDLKVRQAQIDPANRKWWINVGLGSAIVYGGNGLSYYVHHTSLDIDLGGDINTSPPAGATRTHAVYLVVYDKSEAGGGNRYGAEIFVSEDPDGSGAAAPTGVIGSLPLGTFTISNGQTSITDAHITNTAAGVVLGANPRAAATTLAVLPSFAGAAAATWTDFTSGQWPAATFTVPASRLALVTMSGYVEGGTAVGANKTTGLGYRASVAPTFGGQAFNSTRGCLRTTPGVIVEAAKRVMLAWPVSGVSVTLTPQWMVPGSPGAGVDFANAQLIVEPVD
jgi:hypothetical protein